MSGTRAIACCVAGVLLGVGAMWLATGAKGSPGGGERPAAIVRTADSGRMAPIRIEGGAKADEIRALVAEEVRAALREQAVAGTGGGGQADGGRTDADEPRPPTPGFEEARGEVAQRLARGSWTTTDRDWIRTALGSVSAAERTALMGQVIAAANRGAVRVELEGPLF